MAEHRRSEESLHAINANEAIIGAIKWITIVVIEGSAAKLVHALGIYL